MLARAERLAQRRGLRRLSLLHQDAAELNLPAHVDAVLFSLSYSVLPNREAAVQNAWEALRPGGSLVVMDCGLLSTPLGRVFAPVAEVIATIFPGDPYSQPWEDLKSLAPSVRTEWFRLGIYFICTVRKPAVASHALDRSPEVA
jgi:demethylmenaquinone methyltransferase/2-methoxy-6-polyprenyl-1,4-benzoquinol methylase